VVVDGRVVAGDTGLLCLLGDHAAERVVAGADVGEEPGGIGIGRAVEERVGEVAGRVVDVGAREAVGVRHAGEPAVGVGEHGDVVVGRVGDGGALPRAGHIVQAVVVGLGLRADRGVGVVDEAAQGGGGLAAAQVVGIGGEVARRLLLQRHLAQAVIGVDDRAVG